MRRESERAKELERASKVTAKPVIENTQRVKPKPKLKPLRKPARRFNISMHMPRPNLREIHFSRPQFGWRMVSFMLSVLLAAGIYFALDRPELRVRQAQINGSQMISQDEMNAVLDITGRPIFLLTPSDLETRLRLNYPELATVQVTITLPNQVSINVTERAPLIRWEQGGGYTWIAEDGIAFRPRGEMVGLIPVVALSAPPVEGGASDPLQPTPFISPEMVQTLQGLVSHVPQGTPILYEAGYGFGWNDPRGWRVHFGTGARDVELKMRVYESMVASLTTRGIRPALINVMYPSAPFYRMSE